MSNHAFFVNLILLFAAAGAANGNVKQLTKTLNAGKVHEECLLLNVGQQLAYSFETKSFVDFNIHYHLGQEVFYPVKKDATKTHKDIFTAGSAQDYCLMWTNKNTRKVLLKYELQIISP
ncbi:MAG: hypothetical protein AB7F86_02845 [Bdellovibrionales bacterium]